MNSRKTGKPVRYNHKTQSQKLDISEIIDYNEIMQIGETPNPMSSITIRNLDSTIKERLRVRAAEHGPSMEAEARRILQKALSGAGRIPARNLYERIHARFAPLGGIDLELPRRDPAREPPRFD
jgi:plasmid stability protein